MPPKPPPRHDLKDDTGHFNSNKNSNLDFELNPQYTQKFLTMMGEKPSSGFNNNNNNKTKSGDQVMANVRVASIKYNDKYIHNHENKLVINNMNNKSYNGNINQNFSRNQFDNRNYNCKFKLNNSSYQE